VSELWFVLESALTSTEMMRNVRKKARLLLEKDVQISHGCNYKSDL
jgi:hypothetical protein